MHCRTGCPEIGDGMTADSIDTVGDAPSLTKAVLRGMKHEETLQQTTVVAWMGRGHSTVLGIYYIIPTGPILPLGKGPFPECGCMFLGSCNPQHALFRLFG